MTALDRSKQRLAEAKKKSLVELLRKEGYAIEEMGSYYRCLSPLRHEGNGSFDIAKKTGRWRDRGKDVKTGSGDIIDFVMQYKSLSHREAVDFLLGDDTMDIPVYVPEKREREAIEILSVKELSSQYLTDYISSRLINPEVASLYLKELLIRFPYSQKDPVKEHTVLGFKNDSGGYEMRSRYRKVSNSPKNITTVRGVFDGNSWDLHESWPDFLSYLTYYGYTRPEYNTIILNSISFLGAVLPMLQGKVVRYFGQNDSAGDKGYRRLRNEGIVVTDKRFIFRGYKDFNIFLVKTSQNKLHKLLQKSIA
jgi:hypothetical protein